MARLWALPSGPGQGVRTWVVRYVANSRRRRHALGHYLADARGLADGLRRDLAHDRDPAAEKVAARLQAAAADSSEDWLASTSMTTARPANVPGGRTSASSASSSSRPGVIGVASCFVPTSVPWSAHCGAGTHDVQSRHEQLSRRVAATLPARRANASFRGGDLPGFFGPVITGEWRPLGALPLVARSAGPTPP